MRRFLSSRASGLIGAGVLLLAALPLEALPAPASSTPSPAASPAATPKRAPVTKAAPSAKATPVPTPPPSFSRPQLGLRPTDVPELDRSGISEEAQRLAKRATDAFERGDLAAAKRDYEQVLVLAPDNAAASINLGLLAYRQHRMDDAESILRKVVRANPEAGLAWLILGIVYYEGDKLDAALAALAQAAWLEPKDPRVHHYLGVTIGRKGWYSGAEDEMRKAIELQPDYAEAHFNLAVFYLQRNPPALELARRHYQRALDLGAAPDSQVAKLINGP